MSLYASLAVGLGLNEREKDDGGLIVLRTPSTQAIFDEVMRLKRLVDGQ
jgi:hypothetical protein